jgi:AraC-like DNA-binding protein
VLIQLSHNRIGRINLRPLDKTDYPETSLHLRAAHEAKAFLGTIRSHEYISSDGPVFLYSYALQPEVTLRKQDSSEGLKLLLMVEGRLTIQAGITEKLSLAKGRLCLFRSTDYRIELPERTNVTYLLIQIDALVQREGLEYFSEGRYDLTARMNAQLAEILQPPKLLANPERWLSLQLFNLLSQLEEEIKLASEHTNKNNSILDYVLTADAIIKSNLSKNFTTPELALQVGCDECALRKGFLDQFQVTPAKRRTKLRMEQAKEIMLHSNKRISEVAAELGIVPNSLRTNFEKLTETTPLKWRNKFKI